MLSGIKDGPCQAPTIRLVTHVCHMASDLSKVNSRPGFQYLSAEFGYPVEMCGHEIAKCIVCSADQTIHQSPVLKALHDPSDMTWGLVYDLGEWTYCHEVAM